MSGATLKKDPKDRLEAPMEYRRTPAMIVATMPKRNAAITANLSFFVRSSDHSRGTGKARMTMSETMVNMPVAVWFARTVRYKHVELDCLGFALP